MCGATCRPRWWSIAWYRPLHVPVLVSHPQVDEPGEALAASLRSTSPSPRLPPPSVTPPPQGGGEEVKDSRMDEMKDMRIQQLEETVRQLQEKLEAA